MVHRRPIVAVALCIAVILGATACADGTDGKLDSRAEYVAKTVAAMNVRLRDRATTHAKAVKDYANCMYDVIDAHRDELERVKASSAKVQQILAANDDACQAALQKEIGK